MTLAIIIMCIGIGGAATVAIWAMCAAASQADRAFEKWDQERRRHQALVDQLCNWHHDRN